MNEVVVIDPTTAAVAPAYATPSCSARGAVRSAFHGPDGYSLWMCTATLEAGTELHWDAEHGDEVIFVADGVLEHDGRAIGTEGVAVVEADVPAVLVATVPTRVVHFGPSWPRPEPGMPGMPAAEGHGVHRIGAAGRWTLEVQTDAGPVHSRIYADSTCPTCRATLVRNASTAPYVAASHLHSEDEIIVLLSGDMQVGAVELRPGMAVAVPKQRRYRFRSRHGFDFLNYRSDASTYQGAPTDEPVLETASALGFRPTG